MLRSFAVLFLTALAAVQGNPADLRIQTQPAGYTVYYNSFEVKIGADCSFFLVGSQVMMDTGQNGIIGSPGTIGNLCQIDTGASQVLSDGYIFRIQRTGALSTYDVVAHYTEYGGQYSVTTLGQWAAGPPVAGPTLTTPIPGSTLPLSATAFTWTAGTGGVSTYGFRVGTNPGAADLYNQTSTTGLSAYLSGLPSNGAPIYVSLLWLHPATGVWLTNSYTYSASLAITPPQITSPVPGTVITTPSVTVTWNDSPAAETNWTQIGTTAGGGELSQYQTQADTTKLVNVPVTSEPFVFVNVAAQANNSTAGWVSSSVVYATPAAAGAPVPRASKLQAPVAGALLSGNTYFQWDWGNGALDYRLEVGTAPGTANIYNGAASLNSAVYVNVPAHGGLVYATVYTRFATGTLAETAMYSTQSLGQTVPYQPVPAQVIAVGQSTNNPQTATVQWNSGVGVDCYWLSLGTLPNTANLFDQRGECTNQRAATIPTLPTTGANLEPRLYSRINNVWYPTAPTALATVSASSSYQALRLCASSAGTGSVCVLGPGTYDVGPGAHDHIRVERSGITIQGTRGAGLDTVIRRANPVRSYGENGPGAGCGPLITIVGIDSNTPSANISNVTIRDLVIDGGGLAFPGYCTKYPTTVLPDLLDQPSAVDLEITSNSHGTTSGITVDNVLFSNAIGRAVRIYNKNFFPGHPSFPSGYRGKAISGITIRNSEFVEPQLTGILIGQDGAYDDWWLVEGEQGQLHFGPLYDGNPSLYNDTNPAPVVQGPGRGCNAPAASRIAGVYSLVAAEGSAIAAAVPRDLIIQHNRFLRSWTGAIAINAAYNTRVGPGNIFYDNYVNSWDGGGGTVFEEVCSLKSDWYQNAFENPGVPLAVETSAFEMYGRYSKIYDNEIYDQPEGGMHLASTLFHEVWSNRIYDTSRKPSPVQPSNPDYAPIRISNVSTQRQTSDVKLFNNWVRNISTPGYARYGLRLGGCVNGAACGATNLFTNVVLSPPGLPANVFTNMRSPVPMCHESGSS